MHHLSIWMDVLGVQLFHHMLGLFHPKPYGNRKFFQELKNMR